MQPIIRHSWDINESEASKLQRELTPKVVKVDRINEVKLVAGTDVAYKNNSEKLVAAVVILNAETLEIVETASVEDKVRFPYIPGLFSFREIPPLIKAFSNIKNTPDLVVCDGHGYAHPRRFGLACHLGVIFDIPTIGCGKTRLLGEHQNPDTIRGATMPIIDHDEVIGNVLRTHSGIRPIYVSIGHRISLATACKWILNLSPKYRLPETTRQADHLVKMRLKTLN